MKRLHQQIAIKSQRPVPDLQSNRTPLKRTESAFPQVRCTNRVLVGQRSQCYLPGRGRSWRCRGQGLGRCSLSQWSSLVTLSLSVSPCLPTKAGSKQMVVRVLGCGVTLSLFCLLMFFHLFPLYSFEIEMQIQRWFIWLIWVTGVFFVSVLSVSCR